MDSTSTITLIGAGENACILYLPLPTTANYPALLQVLSQVMRKQFAALFDTVPSYRSLLLRFAENYDEAAILEVARKTITAQRANKLVGAEVVIPVCYEDGEFALDKAAMCERTGLSWDQIIALHTSKTYDVYSVGFIPGFAFLGYVDEALESPRHAKVRKEVPKGSIGIAGKQTGFYPLASPGGWQIIGRTPMALYAPEKERYTRVRIGDKVRFQAISRQEFDWWEEL